MRRNVRRLSREVSESICQSIPSSATEQQRVGGDLLDPPGLGTLLPGTGSKDNGVNGDNHEGNENDEGEDQDHGREADRDGEWEDDSFGEEEGGGEEGGEGEQEGVSSKERAGKDGKNGKGGGCGGGAGSRNIRNKGRGSTTKACGGGVLQSTRLRSCRSGRGVGRARGGGGGGAPAIPETLRLQVENHLASSPKRRKVAKTTRKATGLAGE